MTADHRPYKPAWWLPGCHAQTLWPYLFRRLPEVTVIPERLELPDGDFIDLCWTNNQHNRPIVVIFHGLEGSIQSPYVMGMMAAIEKSGWRGVLMHFRGCSGEPNRRQRGYHSGDTGDIAYLIQILRQRYPRLPISAVGYSLGGNALLKYLGERKKASCLNAAVAVSVPFDLAAGAKTLDRGLSRIYQWHLLKRLHKKMRQKFTKQCINFPSSKIKGLTTFYKFDDAITAPLHGFKDVHDYYRQSSSRQYLKDIETRTLLLHAEDDPFMTPEAIPGPDELSDKVQLKLLKRGGHVGFICGNLPWQPVYWLEIQIPEFLQGVMGAANQ